MLDKHRIVLPRHVTRDLSSNEIDKMIDVALTLEPLWENALGPDWKRRMTRDRIAALYAMM